MPDGKQWDGWVQPLIDAVQEGRQSAVLIDEETDRVTTVWFPQSELPPEYIVHGKSCFVKMAQNIYVCDDSVTVADACRGRTVVIDAPLYPMAEDKGR